MKLLIDKLVLDTKKGSISFPLSKNFTYIYGKMGAGKTTVTRLITYCFGEDLIDTPALQQEFISASLHIFTAKYVVILTRQKFEKNKIFVEWQEYENKNSRRYVYVPIIGEKGTSVLPDVHTENISDMLFYLMGVTPPKVRKSKMSEDSDLIRLSFKNILLFWYLDQDNIDSSFFYLDETTGFHKNPSRDVMRMVLGYYYEAIAALETELANLQLKKRGLRETITQLSIFLNENDVGNVGDIDVKIESLRNERNSLVAQRQENRKGISEKRTHISDEIRQSIRQYIKAIEDTSMAIQEVTKQIEMKKQLKEEFVYAGIKHKDLTITRDLLKDVYFHKCPQCGKILEPVGRQDICHLCHQSVFKNEGDVKQFIDIDTDLKERQKEIDVTIQLMSEQKRLLNKELNQLVEKKEELDQVLSQMESEYDSLYLSSVKHFDKSIDLIDADIKYLTKIRLLPVKINNLLNEVASIEKTEKSKREELKKAKEDADKQENRLEKLKEIFLETLIKVNFPGIQRTDVVYMTTHDFYPKIITRDNDIFEVDFTSLSSGGKKTIYKACFALAIQQLLLNDEDSTDIPYPNVLIIDTPMKNISERENIDIFNSFYSYLYNALENELSNLQLIVVDKEFYSPPESYTKDILSVHMTPDNPNSPGLIPYYHGH